MGKKDKEKDKEKSKVKDKEKDKEVDKLREDADHLIVGVTIQIQEMIDALNRQMEELDFKTDRQIRAMGGNSGEQLDDLKGQLEVLSDKLESTKAEIHSKIHDEDVKSYRNTKSLIDQLHGRLGEEVNITQGSVDKIKGSLGILKGILAVGIINALLLVFIIVNSIFHLI